MGEGRLRFIDTSVSGDVLAECTEYGKCFKESSEGETGNSKAIKRVKEKFKEHTVLRRTSAKAPLES